MGCKRSIFWLCNRLKSCFPLKQAGQVIISRCVATDKGQSPFCLLDCSLLPRCCNDWLAKTTPGTCTGAITESLQFLENNGNSTRSSLLYVVMCYLRPAGHFYDVHIAQCHNSCLKLNTTVGAYSRPKTPFLIPVFPHKLLHLANSIVIYFL